jgi:alpha-N-arabinofuranosidase
MLDKNIFGLKLLLFFIILIGSVFSQTKTAEININDKEILGNVNNLVFGNNIIGYPYNPKTKSNEYNNRGAGIWDPDKNLPVIPMEELAKEAGLSVARYPGGNIVHTFDWKKTIGPLSGRSDQKFGLPEFLRFCADIHAIPLITVSETIGTAQDAADLVEYLNLPDDGKHPWATKRAKDGHPEPWNVKWFEFGNEVPYSTNTDSTAIKFGEKFLEYERKIKVIDPSIKFGIAGTLEFSLNDLDIWLKPLLNVIGDNVDFIVHHAYIPSYSRNDGMPSSSDLFSIGLASEEQIQDYYNRMNQIIFTVTSKHTPIAVTEYNGWFAQNKPLPYRLTLGNALINFEMIKIFLNPKNNIIMANSWQYSNEYWGAVKGYTYKNEKLIKRPLYYIFQLFHEHFGNVILNTTVTCNSYETDGGYGVLPGKGTGHNFELSPESIPLLAGWQLRTGNNFSQKMNGRILEVDFNGSDVNYYHAVKNINVLPLTGYRVTGWIKTESLISNRGIGLEVGDGRGWDATKSVSNSPDFIGANDWQKVTVDYVTLPDAKTISIVPRRISGSGSISGKAYIRDISVQRFIPQTYSSVPYLSAIASRDSVNGKIYLFVLNKSMIDSINTVISISGMNPAKAECWILNGPGVDATNELNDLNVSLSNKKLTSSSGKLKISFAPHSLTAIEIY